jgi:hypothetical protein
MLRLLSARYGLGGSLRRYQHERLGIITTLTVSATQTRRSSELFAGSPTGKQSPVIRLISGAKLKLPPGPSRMDRRKGAVL